MLSLRPERLVVAILVVIVATLAARLPVVGPALVPGLALHAAILAGFLLALAALSLVNDAGWREALGTILVAGTLLSLYMTLAGPPFLAFALADALLAAIDRAAFGFDPVVAAARFATPAASWVLAAAYAWFIPYLYLSLLMGLFGRPATERPRFLLGFAATYATSFIGYLFLPAHGPVVFQAAHFVGELPDNPFLRLVRDGIASMGGPHGAFPSLHIAATLYLTMFDLRHSPLRGLIYVPLVILIAAATIALRYHYVVDLVAGAAIAVFALRVAYLVHPVARRAAAPAGGGFVVGLLRRWWIIALLGFFRRIEVEGLEHMPSRGPVLLVANHVNALTDGLIAFAMLNRPVVLTGKSTLARNPLLKRLMCWHGVNLLHRAEDSGPDVRHGENLQRLDDLVSRLMNGEVVLMFPEGVSHQDPAPRRFKTGAVRVAAAYAANPTAGPLTVVPMGLIYTDKSRWRSEAIVSLGPPIMLEGGALPAVQAESMREVVLRRVPWYQRHRDRIAGGIAGALWTTGGHEPDPLGHPLRPLARRAGAERNVAAAWRSADAASVRPTIRRLLGFERRLRRLGIRAEDAFLPIRAWPAMWFVVRELELMLVGLPIAVLGAASHAPIWAILRALAWKTARDEDHWAQSVIVPAIVVVPTVYALWLAALWLLLPWPAALVSTLALPYAGIAALWYRDRLGSGLARALSFIRFLVRPALACAIGTEGRQLIHDLATFVRSAP